MIARDGHAKILDFGLVKDLRAGEQSANRVTELTEAGMVLGLIRCKSPEQVRGESVDPRSFLFRLGVVSA